MAWYNPLSWGKKRTEADIIRARALKNAHDYLASANDVITTIPSNFLTVTAFLTGLRKAKQFLDLIGDQKYTSTLTGIIKKVEDLSRKGQSMTYQNILSETKVIEKELRDLSASIMAEYRTL